MKRRRRNGGHVAATVSLAPTALSFQNVSKVSCWVQHWLQSHTQNTRTHSSGTMQAGLGKVGLRGVPAIGCGGGVLWSTEPRLKSGCSNSPALHGSFSTSTACGSSNKTAAGGSEWFQVASARQLRPESGAFILSAADSVELRSSTSSGVMSCHTTLKGSHHVAIVASRRSRNGSITWCPLPLSTSQLYRAKSPTRPTPKNTNLGLLADAALSSRTPRNPRAPGTQALQAVGSKAKA